MVKTGVDYLIETTQAASSMTNDVARFVDNIKRTEGQSIYDEARSTILERQNKLIESIKGDLSLSVDQWDDAYEERKGTLTQGYENITNKYAAPEIKNLASSLKEDARSSFARDEIAYRRSNALVLDSKTIETGIKTQNQAAINAALFNLKKQLDPQAYAKLQTETTNSFLYNGAMKTADAFLDQGDYEGARKAIRETEFSILLADGTRAVLPDDIKNGQVMKYIDQRYEQLTKESDNKNSLIFADLEGAAMASGAYEDYAKGLIMVNKTQIYDPEIQSRWAHRFLTGMEKLEAKEKGDKRLEQDRGLLILAQRAATKQFTNYDEYLAEVTAVSRELGFNTSEFEKARGFWDKKDTVLGYGLDYVSQLGSTSPGKNQAVKIITKTQETFLQNAVEAYVSDNKNVTTDQVKKFVDGLRNPMFIETISKGLQKEGFSTNTKTDKLELMVSNLENGWIKTLSDNGLLDSFYAEWNIPAKTPIDKMVKEFAKKAEEQAILDVNNMAIIERKSGYKVESAIFSVDESLKAPVVAVKGNDGKTRVFTMRIMTAEDQVAFRTEIDDRAIQFGQKPSLLNEEYWAEITPTDGQPGYGTPRYFGTVGDIVIRQFWGGAPVVKKAPEVPTPEKQGIPIKGGAR
jgi:hypothetical protein